MKEFDEVMKCPKGTFKVDGECRDIPYQDKVKFYADNKNKTIITTHTEYLGKGWYDVRVGNHHKKTRGNETSVKQELLQKHYPGHDEEISLFSELSYHSSIGQDKVGKVSKYGTNDYNKDFSIYKKIAKFKLLQPVKTEEKKRFGKEVDAVDVHKWRYVVIDWMPKGKDDIALQVRDTVKDPITDEDEVLFKSKEIPVSKKQDAFKLFEKRVAMAKKW